MAKRTPKKKTSDTGGPAPPSASPGAARRIRADPPSPKVRVRMYRQGLGDCFLVTFGLGGDERHMLIDCGTLGSKTTGVKIADVVANIRAVTQDHLHLLVATHEHLDHVSGFGSQQKVFEKFNVDHVWMAWTENPDDKVAQKIAKNKRDLGKALAAAALAPTAGGIALQIQDMLGFFGDDHLLGAGNFADGVNKAMEFVRKGLGVQAVYHKPGDGPIEPEWLPGFRFYVLGPPRSPEALGDKGEHGSAELYGMSAGLRAAGLGAAGLGAIYAGTSAAATADPTVSAEPVECEMEMPFDFRFRIKACQALERIPGYFGPTEEWRKIDHDWLRLASDLALQLDSITNNTSLVLVVERMSDGKVLLFPADAQQGNWLSWHDPQLKWSVRDPSGSVREVTASQLLGRTVFYKVGHHASHNATAKSKGLELMTQEDELTAFIPVDRAVALSRNPKGSWKMPARSLYRRLLEKCQGRVARSDIGWIDDASFTGGSETEKEFAGMATNAEWSEWRQSRLKAKQPQTTSLFIDYIMS